MDKYSKKLKKNLFDFIKIASKEMLHKLLK